MPRPRGAAGLLVLALLVPAAAGIGPAPHEAGATTPATLPRVRFVAPLDGSVLVHGTYPHVPSPCADPIQPLLHARFPGTVEIGKGSDGRLFVIVELPFDRYLEGIAEVPRTWPMEALKAQVVAARSYALAHLRYPDPTGDELGYDLCATTACQVYRGLAVGDGPYGDRWRRAVSATDGQVLLFGGRPADTLYFSTSNGHTYGNDEVFGTAPLPYLRPVVEDDDGASPLSHWHAEMPFGDVARFLRAAGTWPGGQIRSIRRTGANVTLSGPGVSRSVDVSDFRDDLNYWAPCLEPASYPGTDLDGSDLPQTVPSRWFSLSTSGRSMVLNGRGWGHGIGMVQWGAEGKAERGMSYRDILAAYYGGLRPKRYEEPATIRIGVATGLTTVRLAGTGGVLVEGRNPGPGPWLVTGGKRLKVTRSFAPPSFISAGTLTVRKTARVGKPLNASLSLPQLSVVQLVIRDRGRDIPLGPRVTLDEGSVQVGGIVPNVPRGPHDIQAIVTDGTDIVRTAPHSIRVFGGPRPSPSPSPSPTPSARSSISTTPAPVALPTTPAGSDIPLRVALALAVAGLLAITLALATRRRARPAPGKGSGPAPRDGPEPGPGP